MEKSTQDSNTSSTNQSSIASTADKTLESSDIHAKQDTGEDIKNQQSNKTLGRLGTMLWAIAYPHLVSNHVKRFMKTRSASIQEKLPSDIQKNSETTQNFLVAVGGKFLQDLLLYAPDEKVTETDFSSRVTIVVEGLKGFFDRLNAATNTDNLPDDLLRFLASISENSSVLPNDHMFDFELQRLQFTHYTTLKSVSAPQSKMIIALFVLLRVLVHQIIMRPWKAIPEIKQEQVNFNNLQVIGSILYHTVVDLLRSRVMTYNNNQDLLPSDLRVRSMSAQLKASDNPSNADEIYTGDELISGLLTKDQLQYFFVDKKTQYDVLKDLINDWLDKMYELTHGVYLNTLKQDKGTLVRARTAVGPLVSPIKEAGEKQENKKSSKLCRILWAIVYPWLLFNDVRQIVKARKSYIQEKMASNIQTISETAQNFLIAVGGKYLQDLILFSPDEKFPETDFNSRITVITEGLKGFFDKLIAATTMNNLPQNLLRFLASISENSSVLPRDYMFAFEIQRLQFSYYSTLKSVSPLQAKMIIAMFILMRVLVHQIIMSPWKAFPEIKQEQVNMNNLHTIGSILYHTIVDFVRSTVAVYPNNQAFLPLELRTKPRSTQLTALDNPANTDLPYQADELISGFMTKDQLQQFFVDRKNQYDILKALVDGWLEKIYQLTHTVYLNTPRKDRATMGISA